MESNIQFNLNRGLKIEDLNKPQSIYFRYTLGRKVDFKASLKKKVLPDDWDIKKQRVKNRTHILESEEINTLISDLITHFNEFDKENTRKGIIPSRTTVKKHYEKYFTIENDKEPEVNTLFGYIQHLIDRPDTKRNLSKGTIKNYILTQTFLKRFNDEVYPLNFENINLEWYNDFVEWCEGQGLSLNYIGKHIKTLKTFMNHAVEDEKTTNVQYLSKRFKVLKEDADNVYLNLSELIKLWKLDLSKQPRKENVRDLFLLGAFTGLRVSDYNNLSKENIIELKGVKMVKIKTQKTGKEVAIPLHPIVKSILEKNNGEPPRKVPDQKINELIKDIAESAGIDEVVFTEQTRGGRKVKKKNYKFEMIKTHTARRSFCTNAYLSGMSTIDIMSLSGHTTERAFLNYIKVSNEERAVKMSSSKFFQWESNLKVV